MNRKDWSPTSQSVICIDHFDEKFIKRGKKCKLLWQLHPVPTIHNDSKSNPSLLRTPTISRKSPRKRKIGVDELVLFQAADKIVDIGAILEQNSPENCTIKNFSFHLKIYFTNNKDHY